MDDAHDHWVVLWDPPINKGTTARVFHDAESAWTFVREHLEPVSWLMNIRVLHASERLWQDF